MKVKFIILYLLFFNICFSQSEKKQSLIDDQIKKIDWSSFQVVTNYFVQIVLKDSLENKLGYKDSTLVCKLFKNLTINSKTVTINILLTQILEPQNSNFEYYYKDKKNVNSNNYDNNKDLISYYYNDNKNVIIYHYNNLKWSFDLNTNQYDISKTEIKKIKKYWKKIINKTFKIDH